jgi:hypothetical protein
MDGGGIKDDDVWFAFAFGPPLSPEMGDLDNDEGRDLVDRSVGIDGGEDG